MSSSSGATAVKGGTGTVSTPANNVGGDPAPSARRGSNSSTKFSGLMNQKRNSGDAAAAARRASFNEQKPQPGVIGSLWDKFTTGGHK